MDLALDDDGDLLIEGGDATYLDGVDAILQHISIRLQFFLGEWEWDTRVGIPYFEKVLVKSPDLNVVRNLLRTAITDTPGVTALTSFELALGATRTLQVSFEADTEEGPLTFDRELILT